MLDLPRPEDDGLIIPTVGEWSRDKHHFLARYIDAFTTAMKDKSWSALHYIDLFAGAGIERLKTSGQLDWGSPLIAAQATYPFTGLHLCELNSERSEALRRRLDRLKPKCFIQTLEGDANEVVHEIMRPIRPRSLSLAFLDPYGLHLDFETLRILAEHRADLIIFFPDRLDILRNWQPYYFDNPQSKLDRVLGPGADWRSIPEREPPERWGGVFRDMYRQQLKTLGYVEFEYEGIPSHGRRLYWLIFCSRHRAGGRIWRNVALKKPDQQTTFDFGPS